MAHVTHDTGQTNAIETALHGSGPERRQAVEHIIAAHWKPLYKYLRFRHDPSPGDAQALMAHYLEDVLKPGFFFKFDPRSGPLRNFLRKELDRFAGHWKGERRAPGTLPIDYASADEEYQSEKRFAGIAADEYFESEWVRNVFALAVGVLQATLETEGKNNHFMLFIQSDLQDRTSGERAFLDEIARELGMPINDAMNALATTRQTFHHIMKDIVRSLTTTDAEFKQELGNIFKGS
jgi:hypothetical protein